MELRRFTAAGGARLTLLLCLASGCESAQAPAFELDASGSGAISPVPDGGSPDAGPRADGLHGGSGAADAAPQSTEAGAMPMLADAGLDGGPDVSDADSGSDASLGPGRDAQVASDSDADVMEAGTLPDQDAGGASDANPGADDGDAEPDSDAMAPYTFKVDSKDVWSASNFQVTQDSCYLVTATIDDQWLDLDVVSNLNGWIDKSNPLYGLFVALRRVPQDDIAFYQFAACVDRDTKACFAIGDAATICPKKSGELFFFVNDVPGFESNNVGTATVRIAKKP